MIMYAPSTSAVARRRRERDSAAIGSTHSTYHGSTQLSVTSSATLDQPDAVTADPRRHACTQHNSTDTRSAPVSTECSASVSPPAPIARPIRFGTLTFVTSELCVL